MFSMGFARLAESTIRKAKGKGEDEKLSALEKIAASSIGGALATWNQPIEVVRVEVCSEVNSDSILGLINLLDAIYGQERIDRQAWNCWHIGLHLPRKWSEGLVSWRHPSDWSRNLADCLHGLIRGLCQGLGGRQVDIPYSDDAWTYWMRAHDFRDTLEANLLDFRTIYSRILLLLYISLCCLDFLRMAELKASKACVLNRVTGAQGCMSCPERQGRL